jgi:transcriptional regulator with XRE-family HTH domain
MATSSLPVDRSRLIGQLKAERKRRGLTLQQLGERIGRSTYQTIWQWENGTSPTLHNLCQWADALGFDVALVPKAKP